MPSVAPFPRDFFCERPQAKSRVFAVLASPNRADTLKAVLTCTDPHLAQRAASVLASLALTGGGAMIDAEAETIHAALPWRLPPRSARPASVSGTGTGLTPTLALPGGIKCGPVTRKTSRQRSATRRRGPRPTPSSPELTGKVFRIIQFAGTTSTTPSASCKRQPRTGGPLPPLRMKRPIPMMTC